MCDQSGYAHSSLSAGRLGSDQIVVGLGGNIGELPALQVRLQEAVASLSSALGPARLSNYYVSSPVGAVRNQPDFMNAVAVWQSDNVSDSEQLLRLLQEVENSHARKREIVGGARTLDLDLLYHGVRVRRSDTLVLPHPRLLERAFVVQPMQDLFGANFTPLNSALNLGEILRLEEIRVQGIRRYSPRLASDAKCSTDV